MDTPLNRTESDSKGFGDLEAMVVPVDSWEAAVEALTKDERGLGERVLSTVEKAERFELDPNDKLSIVTLRHLRRRAREQLKTRKRPKMHHLKRRTLVEKRRVRQDADQYTKYEQFKRNTHWMALDFWTFDYFLDVGDTFEAKTGKKFEDNLTKIKVVYKKDGSFKMRWKDRRIKDKYILCSEDVELYVGGYIYF